MLEYLNSQSPRVATVFFLMLNLTQGKKREEIYENCDIMPEKKFFENPRD